MSSEYTLIQKGTLWEFSRESEFEDYLWENLDVLLGVKPLKRQYYSQGNFCDILAVTSQKELAILELKITEDRYILQQLTRYYHSLYKERPFSDEIDFNKPVKLIAMLPKVHSDNLIDAIYSKLNINFITYNLSEESEKVYLSLIDHASQLQISKTEIRLKASEYDDGELPKIPSKLLKILSQSSQEEKAKILAVRSNFLRFNKKINETISGDSVIYGCGKTKPIMEIRFDTLREKPTLFLWLPFSSSQTMGYKSRRTILRIKIWTDWLHVFYFGYIRSGNGVMITPEEYKVFPVNLIPASLLPGKQSKFSELNFHKSYFAPKVSGHIDPIKTFENDQVFRDKYTHSILSFFDRNRQEIYFQKHGDPLAITVKEYIKLTKSRMNLETPLLLSNQLDLSKTDFTLDEFINLALQERL
jgi:RecB family endonuclease NucS